MKKKTLQSFTLLICLLLLPSVSAADKKVLRVSDGKTISFTEMIQELKSAKVVFVGEVHDSSKNHQQQLDVIRALHESDRPVAVGLEMFRKDSQEALDQYVAGKLPTEQFMPVYYNNWSMPWPLYGEILEYAREQRISLVGLNIPDKIARKIGQEGFAALTEAEKKHLPPGISCNIDPTYMEFIKRAYAGHAMHGGEFANFCQAQLVWDKSMAWNLMEYLKKNQDRTMVVLAGVGHAWKRGISGHVEEHSNLSYRVVLPLIKGQLEKKTVTIEDADYLLLD